MVCLYARLILASIPACLYSVLLNYMVIISHHKYSVVWCGYISQSYKYVAEWKEGLFHQLNLYLVSSPQACNNNSNKLTVHYLRKNQTLMN